MFGNPGINFRVLNLLAQDLKDGRCFFLKGGWKRGDVGIQSNPCHGSPIFDFNEDAAQFFVVKDEVIREFDLDREERKGSETRCGDVGGPETQPRKALEGNAAQGDRKP